MRKRIERLIEESIECKRQLLNNSKPIEDAIKYIIRCLRSGGKVILFGNGGSASDAQHIAAEFIGRFKLDRKALPAIDLSSNTSVLTALSNDFGYENTFVKQVEAFVKKKDIIMAFSTSGNSSNVIEAVKLARKKGALIIGFTGYGGGKMKRFCDVLISAPSKDTPRIQEAHITIGHIICEIVEDRMFNNAKR